MNSTEVLFPFLWSMLILQYVIAGFPGKDFSHPIQSLHMHVPGAAGVIDTGYSGMVCFLTATGTFPGCQTKPFFGWFLHIFDAP